ncbi:MAG: outer membrane protein [Candidatus Aminicenantales bacterium]
MEGSGAVFLRKEILLTSLFLLLLGGNIKVWAEGFAVHANGGLSLPRENNVKSGLGTGFGFSFSLHKKLSISFDFDFSKSEVVGREGELLDGHVSANPFLATLQYAVLEKNRLTPYLFMGMGYVFYNFRLEDIITIPEVTISQKIENDLAFQAGLGVRLQIGEQWDLFGEAFYLHCKTQGRTTTTDLNFGTKTEEFPLDMSTSAIRLGIRYRF